MLTCASNLRVCLVIKQQRQEKKKVVKRSWAKLRLNPRKEKFNRQRKRIKKKTTVLMNNKLLILMLFHHWKLKTLENKEQNASDI